MQLRETEPVSPRRLNASVPRDLETICLKCLEKEPHRRYHKAEEIADELGRFLSNEPLLARPVSRPERVWRWCRRRPIIAGLVLALHFVAALGLFGVLWQWRRAVAGELTARQHQYVSDMNLVGQVWEEGNLKRAQDRLRAYIPKSTESDLRGFEWRYLWKLCQDESYFSFKFPSASQMVISPDARIAAAASGSLIKLLDYANGRELDTLSVTNATDHIDALAFSPADHNVLATASGKMLNMWNLTTRQVAGTVHLSNPASAVAISREESSWRRRVVIGRQSSCGISRAALRWSGRVALQLQYLR